MFFPNKAFTQLHIEIFGMQTPKSIDDTLVSICNATFHTVIEFLIMFEWNAKQGVRNLLFLLSLLLNQLFDKYVTKSKPLYWLAQLARHEMSMIR